MKSASKISWVWIFLNCGSFLLIRGLEGTECKNRISGLCLEQTVSHMPPTKHVYLLFYLSHLHILSLLLRITKKYKYLSGASVFSSSTRRVYKRKVLDFSLCLHNLKQNTNSITSSPTSLFISTFNWLIIFVKKINFICTIFELLYFAFYQVTHIDK